jgi:ClpP class serine protease
MMTQLWMIDPGVETQLRPIFAQTVPDADLPEQVSAAAKPVTVVAGVASIPISGVLVNERNRFLDYFGVAQTSYKDITAQILEAEADTEVKSIEFQVDSGGGAAGNSLVATADTLFATTKPTVAVVDGMAASAAYWLAAQADEVVLAGPASMVGSIGVVVDLSVSDRHVSVTSTDAPKKRPDVTTESGRADVRRVLDDMHALFASAVARGRGVSAATVNSDFGQGGMFLASEAVTAGMADRVLRASPAPTSAPVARHGTLASMDLETLAASEPKLYAQIVAIGEARERSRVNAHLSLADKSGQMAETIKHIEAGLPVSDDSVLAAHLGGAITAMKQNAAAADNPVDIKVTEAPTQVDQSQADIDATFANAGI